MEYSAGTFIMQQSWHFEGKLLSMAGGQHRSDIRD